MLRWGSTRILFLSLVALLSAATMMAQTAGTATLVGNVTDASGALVVGAKVTVVNTANAFVSESLTSSRRLLLRALSPTRHLSANR